MATWRLMDGTAGRPGNGPAIGTSYAGNLVAGCAFGVNAGGYWLEGYYWWPPLVNGDTASGQKFALWQVTGLDVGVLVPGGTVTAGLLTAGQWNFIPLTAPLLLSPYSAGAAMTYGAVYVAVTGKTFTSGFPETKNQFGTGDTYSAGITNGPLTGFSSLSGSAPVGGSSGFLPQQPFAIAADPTTAFPTQNDSDANLWIDVQISDTAPASPSYRAWPNSPRFVVPGQSPSNLAYTLGVEFTLSESCDLVRIWHYSPSGVTVLPTRCAIWDVATMTVVSGTDNTSPTWSGAAGSGWVSCDYTGAGVTLAGSTNYKVSTFTSDNTDTWFLASTNWWGGSPGPFSGGVTQGPLDVLGNAAASPGQDSWHQSAIWTYPATSTNPEFDGLDVEVAPSSGSPVTGTGAVTMAAMAAAGTGDERITSAGAVTMAAMAVAGEGTETGSDVTATGSVTMPLMAVAGTNKKPGGGYIGFTPFSAVPGFIPGNFTPFTEA